MAWMETDYSKHTHFRWKIKWRLEHLGTLGIMGEVAPLTKRIVHSISSQESQDRGLIINSSFHRVVWSTCVWETTWWS